MVTNTAELIGNIKLPGSLGCSDHELVEFTVLRNMEKARITTVNFMKAKFRLFKKVNNKMAPDRVMWLACQRDWMPCSGTRASLRCVPMGIS